MRPSPITWRALTRPYAVTTATGRRRPPYTEATLARAITQGIDPAGHPLDPAMPRFSLSQAELNALIAFLKRIEERREPGVGSDTLRLGTVLPQGKTGDRVEAVLRAFFEEKNVHGIYGRRLELHAKRIAHPSEVQAAVRDLAGKAFILIAPYLTGAEEAALAEVKRLNLPLVTPFAHFTPEHGEAFFLLSGWGIQTQALVKAASPPLFVIPSEGREAQAALDEAKKLGLPLAQNLQEASAVLFLERGLPLDLPIRTRLLLLGEQAGSSLFRLPKDRVERVLVAYPFLPSDGTPEGKEAFHAFLRRHELPRDLAGRLAYATAKVVEAGLEGAGRTLTRRRFKEALERLHRFETGVTPPLTFKGRHIGAYGAYVTIFGPRALQAHWVVP